MEILYGINPVTEALRSGTRTFNDILCTRERAEMLRPLAGKIHIQTLSRQELDRIARTKYHQGVIGHVSSFSYSSLEDIFDAKTVLLLDSVEDPQNLGAIIRSAHALAEAAIVIPSDRSASITPAVSKASAGAAEHARIARVTNLRAAAKELKKNGFWLVGLDARGDQPLADLQQFDKLGIVMGGEDSGIRPVMLKELDLLARIPMQSDFNSLNVAQSATIALYELVARR